ncbi:hypothetical protein M407DRAFT_4023 [Tulasnella calospora MUT 4182]|uniref:Uncharacterized protein n=1 Tax=Tulasnella calospora MUT 4182 TaxID=1051891 RepID=A0A0C3QWI3_9AGAM|nr:hypothetical protein M407DRAFT_4023 [Tulasnella calospora MUT 4182]
MDQFSPPLQGTSSQPLKSPGSERSPSSSSSSGGDRNRSSELPRHPIGDSWLSRPNLGEELRRQIRKTNHLSVTLWDGQLHILFGKYGHPGKSVPALFGPIWILHNAVEAAAIIAKVMKVCGPIIKDLQVDVALELTATAATQLFDDQNEPGQRAQNQWLWDVASITLKANIISFRCRDEATWDGFTRFLTSRNNQASNGESSLYPWPDMCILQLHAQSPDLIRSGHRTLATYVESENRSIEEAPALSRLCLPGSFYNTRDAANPETQWILEHVQPRAEDDNTVNTVNASMLSYLF